MPSNLECKSLDPFFVAVVVVVDQALNERDNLNARRSPVSMQVAHVSPEAHPRFRPSDIS